MNYYNNTCPMINDEIDAIIESLDYRDTSEMDVIYEGFSDTIKGAGKAIASGFVKVVNGIINTILKALNSVLNLFRKMRGKETKEYEPREFIGRKKKNAGTTSTALVPINTSVTTTNTSAPVAPAAKCFVKTVNQMGLLLTARSKEDAETKIRGYLTSADYEDAQNIIKGKYKTVHKDVGETGISVHVVKNLEDAKELLNRYNNKINSADFYMYTGYDPETGNVIKAQLTKLQAQSLGLLNVVKMGAN